MQINPLGVGCSGRVLERPLERPLARAWAGAQTPLLGGAPPSPRAVRSKAQKTHVESAFQLFNEEGIWLHSAESDLPWKEGAHKQQRTTHWGETNLFGIKGVT